MLSELTGIFSGQMVGIKKIIMGGNLNAGTQFNKMQKNNSLKIFFDRIDHYGLNDIYQLSKNQSHLQILRHASNETPTQNDYFFVINSIANTLKSMKSLIMSK